MKIPNPQSKIWIYTSNCKFTNTQVEEIQNLGNEFVSQWKAHGNQLSSCFEIRYQQFIIISVFEENQNATGCSIDNSVSFIKTIEQKFQCQLLNHRNIAYRNTNGDICIVDFIDFQNLISQKLITPKTVVFNNQIKQYLQLENIWEIPAEKSWHKKYFE